MKALRNLMERWPVRRRSWEAGRLDDVMEEAVAFSAERWVGYCEIMDFAGDVPLNARIGGFMVSASDGLIQNFPSLKRVPDTVILLILARGIEASGTHARDEIEAALKTKLP